MEYLKKINEKIKNEIKKEMRNEDILYFQITTAKRVTTNVLLLELLNRKEGVHSLIRSFVNKENSREIFLKISDKNNSLDEIVQSEVFKKLLSVLLHASFLDI